MPIFAYAYSSISTEPFLKFLCPSPPRVEGGREGREQCKNVRPLYLHVQYGTQWIFIFYFNFLCTRITDGSMSFNLVPDSTSHFHGSKPLNPVIKNKLPEKKLWIPELLTNDAWQGTVPIYAEFKVDNEKPSHRINWPAVSNLTCYAPSPRTPRQGDNRPSSCGQHSWWRRVKSKHYFT